VSRRCAIYGRYSSDLQSPTSIEDQIRLCRAYAEQRGWTVVASFEDAALSGFGTEHRPGYRQLLAAALAAEHPFDVILVEGVDRLSRDSVETMTVYRRLRLRGVEIIGVSDGIATGRQGAKVHLAVRGLVNELYLDDLREKTHRGMAGRLAHGLSTGGRIFGYRAVPVADAAPSGKRSRPARLEIVPAEAAVVQRVFLEYAHGRSMKTIVQTLNSEGVPCQGYEARTGPAGLGRLKPLGDPAQREVRRRMDMEQDSVRERPGQRASPSGAAPSGGVDSARTPRSPYR
jgi:site-specific DNA recombinase